MFIFIPHQGPQAGRLPAFPVVLYHMVNWLAGSEFAARTEGRQPSSPLSLLPCLALPFRKPSASAALSHELPKLSRRMCASVCHTITQTPVRTRSPLAAVARPLKGSYHPAAHVLGCGCICKGRKEAGGGLQEKTKLPAPLVPALFV